MDKVDTIIIGAGIVGLAIARSVARQGRDVLILEAEGAIASITSARNSGVLHAGLHYKVGSLKARLCVEGRRKLYDYCVERGIPHRRCGKLVVATDEAQLEALHELYAVGIANGVEDLRLLTAAEAQQFESEVFCVAAIHSPASGIIDVHHYAMALLGEAESYGAMLALHSPVIGGEVTTDGFILEIGGATPSRIACSTLINAAGLGAQKVAQQLTGLSADTIPPQALAKGNYFSLTGRQPFSMLIYPVPVLGSAGLHAGCDMAGRVRFGPDIEWVDHVDYQVDPSRQVLFETAVRRYWPSLPDGALIPDYCGIRPKLAKAGHHDTDFIIQGDGEHHVPGLINLYGIESPGLTSSLALGDRIACLLP